MIVPVKTCARRQSVPAWHARFLKLLPRIKRHAQIAFGPLPPETREDLVQETIANAMVAYVRLYEQGRSELAFASVLARYAVAQIRDGRRVGSRLLTRGGTILGTANRGRFSAKVGHGETRRLPQELIDGVKAGMQKLNIRGLVSIGGDGSLSIGQQLFEGGVPLVGVPKTIDNDLEGTVMTFGFDSAVACATDALDRLHTTAESHNRIMVLEVMGRYAGWIALYAGVAGGADVILIPEIPFSYEAIYAKIQEREKADKHFTLIVAAEGARQKGGDFVTSGEQVANREARLGGVAAIVAAELEKRTGKEARACVLGHLQRGGSPTNFDRALCTIFGAEAVELIAAEKFGHMVAYEGSRVGSVKITEAVGRLKTVPPTGSFVRTARALGTCLGD